MCVSLYIYFFLQFAFENISGGKNDELIIGDDRIGTFFLVQEGIMSKEFKLIIHKAIKMSEPP
jgi:hypothetical protein